MRARQGQLQRVIHSGRLLLEWLILHRASRRWRGCYSSSELRKPLAAYYWQSKMQRLPRQEIVLSLLADFTSTFALNPVTVWYLGLPVVPTTRVPRLLMPLSEARPKKRPFWSTRRGLSVCNWLRADKEVLPISYRMEPAADEP